MNNNTIAIDTVAENPSNEIPPEQIEVEDIQLIENNVFKIKVDKSLPFTDAQELLIKNREVGSGFYFTNRVNNNIREFIYHHLI